MARSDNYATDHDYFEVDENLVPSIAVTEHQGLNGVQVHLVQSVDEAMECKRWLSERRNGLAVDTETSGLHYQHGRLRLIQIGDTRHGWAFPAESWKGAAVEMLSAYEGPIVMHNSAFDVKWLRAHTNWRIPYHRLHDTMIASHIIDPNRSHALKSLAVTLVDKRANAGEQMLKEAFANQRWSWDTVPVDYGPYWQYGALDAVLTAHLYEIIDAQRQYPQVYDLEMACRNAITSMEWNGSRIDLEYCEQKHQQLTEYVDRVKAWGRSTFGINLGSSQQLVRLFQSQGAHWDQTTEKGEPAMTKYVLRLLKSEGYELAGTILAMRKSDKLASSYFKNFVELQIDGIVHPNIKTLGARTGRMSMTDPALQTLPKGEATVRRAYVPRHEDEAIVTADYSQIEMRLMAHFSQDEGLCQTFFDADTEPDGDFFVNIARDIYQDPEFQKSDKRRGLVKNTLYGKAYGAGIPKMAQTAGVIESVMAEVVHAFDARYPGVQSFQRSLEQVGNERIAACGEPYVITPYGRRLPSSAEKLYVLTNYLIQGHAAEMLKKSIVSLAAAGFEDAMMLPVHDEVVFSIPRADLADAIPAIKETMSVMEGYRVPIPAEPEGPFPHWGKKYE